MKRYIGSVMVMVLLVSSVVAGESAFSSLLAKRAQSKYEKRVEEIKEEYEEKLEEAQKEYKSDLKKAFDKAMEEKNLEEAIRIKSAIENIGNRDNDGNKETNKTFFWLVGRWNKKEDQNWIIFHDDKTYTSSWEYTRDKTSGVWRIEGDKIIVVCNEREIKWSIENENSIKEYGKNVFEKDNQK